MMPEAFAAVTVPSLSKAGRSLAIDSTVTPAFGYSSVSTTTSPLRDLTGMGATSVAIRPLSHASFARC